MRENKGLFNASRLLMANGKAKTALATYERTRRKKSALIRSENERLFTLVYHANLRSLSLSLSLSLSSVCSDVASGMLALHSMRLVHRDLAVCKDCLYGNGGKKVIHTREETTRCFEDLFCMAPNCPLKYCPLYLKICTRFFSPLFPVPPLGS